MSSGLLITDEAGTSCCRKVILTSNRLKETVKNDHLLDILKRLYSEEVKLEDQHAYNDLGVMDKDKELDFCCYPKDTSVVIRARESNQLRCPRPSNPYRNDVFR